MSPSMERDIDRAALLLLHGVTGDINASAIARGTGLVSKTVDRTLMRMQRHVDGGELPAHADGGESRERVLLYIFRRLNAHVVLGPEDRE